jgi:hypothetical protein
MVEFCVYTFVGERVRDIHLILQAWVRMILFVGGNGLLGMAGHCWDRDWGFSMFSVRLRDVTNSRMHGLLAGLTMNIHYRS